MTPRDRTRARVLAALLAQGRTVHLLAMALGIGAFLVADGWIGVAVAAVLAVETWLAARVGLDARLFEALADGLAPDALDQGLVDVGLVDRTPPRVLDDRIRGATRLWRAQLVATGLLGGVLLLGWWT
jgi:hypothetical protein